MTLAGMLAGSTLASLARDGLSRLVHPAAAAPSTDSDSGPERASDSTRRLESRRRPSQQVSRSQSRGASQQPQSAPSRRLSQIPSGQGVGSKRSQQRSQVAQQQSRELSQRPVSGTTRQPVEDEPRSRQDQDGRASQRDSQPVINQPKSQEIHPEPKGAGKQKSPDEGSLDPKSSPSHLVSLKDNAESQKEQSDVSKNENGSSDGFKSQTNLVDQCTVSRLRFCDGRLPYRTTSLPNFAGASSDQELVDNLVFFEAISESGCSPLAAEYVCAAMEPQCVSRPTPHVLPPCRHFCQDIVSSCGAAIPSSLSRNRAFNCSLMPDSTDPSVCYSSAADGCVLSEFACADQTSCLPAEWRCDGTPQCDDDSDELGCDGCSPLQYRCRPAGGCVDRSQLCDVTAVP
ncbi:uncharacterized protein LOC122369019 [Amphibalanus amphitrite]|uniref:uncharacterized protein LOC122369019 n=1 Tax=Amphibalanus amphitrite TaxID=1232801 RepID=UPI001C906223|nr:uncharacterized protein LOC122369019 [Amphibalanus amphitrite]